MTSRQIKKTCRKTQTQRGIGPNVLFFSAARRIQKQEGSGKAENITDANLQNKQQNRSTKNSVIAHSALLTY